MNGMNALDLIKMVEKMIRKYGTDIVFEWDGDMRILDFENNLKNVVR